MAPAAPALRTWQPRDRRSQCEAHVARRAIRVSDDDFACSAEDLAQARELWSMKHPCVVEIDLPITKVVAGDIL